MARPSTIGATRPDATPRGNPVLARTASASPTRDSSPMPAIPVFQHDRLIVTQSD
jgi:hypothetical protein